MYVCLSIYELLLSPDINSNPGGLFMGSFYGEGLPPWLVKIMEKHEIWFLRSNSYEFKETYHFNSAKFRTFLQKISIFGQNVFSLLKGIVWVIRWRFFRSAFSFCWLRSWFNKNTASELN